MLVERIIKIYTPTEKGQPVPLQSSRSLLNQEAAKSRLEPEDTSLIMRLGEKESSGPEWN